MTHKNSRFGKGLTIQSQTLIFKQAIGDESDVRMELRATSHTRQRAGLSYTMDHEVGLGRCKSVDWLLNSSRDHFGLH